MRELVERGTRREDLLYVNFEDERLGDITAAQLSKVVDAHYRRNPSARSRAGAMFFDEIQLVAGWERFVRRLVDTEPAHVCVTGSSAKLLSREIATSLRGRSLTAELFPFSLAEALEHGGITPDARPPAKARSDSHSERARQVNPRKVYAIDPGLVTACARRGSTDTGQLLETAVFIELRRRTDELAYLRTSSGYEVDFVTPSGLVQSCTSLDDPATRAREVRALREAMSEQGVDEATIVTLSTDEQIAVAEGTIRVVPFWRWALDERTT